MQKLLSDVPENIKLIVTSISPLIIVSVLFAVIGQFGITKIMDIRNQITKAEKDQTILTRKLDFLQTVSNTIKEDSGLSLAALPNMNPSLIILPQLKITGSNNGVLISGVKSGSPISDTAGLYHVDISFQTSGTRSQIMSFLNNISLIAPITIVDKVKITESAGTARADVAIKSYWSLLPKDLPATTSPINDLTAAEKKTLKNISGLVQPMFVNIPASSESGKVDPFSR